MRPFLCFVIALARHALAPFPAFFFADKNPAASLSFFKTIDYA